MFKRLREIFFGRGNYNRRTDAEENAAAQNRAVNVNEVPQAERNYNPINYDKPVKDTEPGKAEW